MTETDRTSKSRGRVYLVGAGPGDIGLFTLRGVELLRRAEVVIYDGLVNRDLLRFAPAGAEIIYAGKHDRSRCVSQEEINSMLLAKAREGKCVVRLKGGDPYLFGRGGEEAELLADAGIPFEVVPGVSSVQSVPSYAGIPLTHREHNSAVTIVTGHQDPFSPECKLDWKHLAGLQGTIVVLMGLKNLEAIAQALITHGRSAQTPVAVISRGATPKQRTITGTLADIANVAVATSIAPPAVIVIGEVVALREKLSWFEKRPLFGKRIVVTQRSDLAAPLVALLREQGAEVSELPATRWVPLSTDLDHAMDRIQHYDWVLFSNPQVVDLFFENFLRQFHDLRLLGNICLGAYGPRTGERLKTWNLRPAAVAVDHKRTLIIEAIERCSEVRGKRFLVLRGENAHENVPEALTRLGALADTVTTYSAEPETAYSQAAAIMREPGPDWIIFATGLAIEHFHSRFDLPGLLQRFPAVKLAIASPTIRWALENLGLQPAITSQANDIHDLVRKILENETT